METAAISSLSVNVVFQKYFFKNMQDVRRKASVTRLRLLEPIVHLCVHVFVYTSCICCIIYLNQTTQN